MAAACAEPVLKKINGLVMLLLLLSVTAASPRGVNPHQFVYGECRRVDTTGIMSQGSVRKVFNDVTSPVIGEQTL
jgi:hypothetical protein